jgi:hypothetical protein
MYSMKYDFQDYENNQEINSRTQELRDSEIKWR